MANTDYRTGISVEDSFINNLILRAANLTIKVKKVTRNTKLNKCREIFVTLAVASLLAISIWDHFHFEKTLATDNTEKLTNTASDRDDRDAEFCRKSMNMTHKSYNGTHLDPNEEVANMSVNGGESMKISRQEAADNYRYLFEDLIGEKESSCKADMNLSEGISGTKESKSTYLGVTKPDSCPLPQKNDGALLIQVDGTHTLACKVRLECLQASNRYLKHRATLYVENGRDITDSTYGDYCSEPGQPIYQLVAGTTHLQKNSRIMAKVKEVPGMTKLKTIDITVILSEP